MFFRLREILLVALVLLCGRLTAFAAPGDQGSASKPKSEGYRLQQFDEPLLPLDPITPRSDTDKSKVDAVAWFMTGRFREARNDFKGALEAYKKAADLDPKAIEVYRTLVPLAFNLNQTEDAIKYGLRAIEIDPGDVGLLRRIGVEMARRRDLPKAIQLLEQASQSPKINKRSGAYIMLMRDLGILYGATGQKEKTADCFHVVFEALTEKEKFDLDQKTRLALVSDVSTTFERIGQAFLDADRDDLAVKAFEEAAKASKGKPGKLSYSLAKVYLKTKQAEKALTELQKYFDAQLQSKGRSAYELLADILKSLNKSDDLIPRLERLSEIDSKNATLQYYLADQYTSVDRLDDAEKLYKKALADSPDTQGYLGLSVIYRKQNRAEDLLENLALASSRAQNSEEIDAELKKVGENEKLLASMIEVGRKRSKGDSPTLDFAQSYLLAQLASTARKTEEAMEFYRFALKKSPAQQLATIYQEFGSYLMQGDKYADASQIYDEATKEPGLQAQKPIFLYYLSQAHEMNGKTDEALTAIGEAQKLRPDIPLLQFQEGWVHYHAEKWDEAVKLFEQVMAKFPQDKETVRRCQFSISNIFVQKGEMRKGEEILEKILAEDPDDPSVNNDLGYLYADQGKNLEKAEKMIKKAITAEPDNAAYLDSMGWVLYKLNRFDEALPYLEKSARSETGGDATIWDHLGDCYHQLKKSDKAVDAWKKALKDAKEKTRPDKKLIEKIEQKLKTKPETTSP